MTSGTKPSSGACDVDARLCPLCQMDNFCGNLAVKNDDEEGVASLSCWCATVTLTSDLLASIPESARGKACVCQQCALKYASSNTSGEPSGSELAYRADSLI